MAKAFSVNNSAKRLAGKSDGNSTMATVPAGGRPRMREPNYGGFRGCRPLQMWMVVVTLLIMRFGGAYFNPINDCDEVFNYWEPVHFLTYGWGLQTWEYSPQYAIRSYAYLWLYAGPTKLMASLGMSKEQLFYVIRLLISLFGTFCEVVFYRGVQRQFNLNVVSLTYWFLFFGTGMFIASSAFLPSTFSMHCLMLAYGFWMENRIKLSILASGANILLGWPFAGLLSAVLAVDILFVKRKVLFFLSWTVIFGLLISLPVILVDSYYYGRFIFAPLNIVLYNVFSPHGPDLYGTEPWTFYFYNCLLNWNFVFIPALFSLPINFIAKRTFKALRKRHAIVISSALSLWLAVFFAQPHKEERFMFPAYPLIALSAAIAIDELARLLSSHWPRLGKTINQLMLCSLVLFGLTSLSRSSLIAFGYNAPLKLYSGLDRLEPPPPATGTIQICVGKEWHRFPSSFFLPDQRWQLQFIKSEFAGLLPKPWSTGADATRTIPTGMNDLNIEDRSRYVNVNQCDYLVDSDYDEYTDLDYPYSKDHRHWTAIKSANWLDHAKIAQPWRSFYLPAKNGKYHYLKYNLLKRHSRQRA